MSADIEKVRREARRAEADRLRALEVRVAALEALVARLLAEPKNP